ncbi:MAG: hypothetical protein ABMA02_02970 [Saprospiraceae bacterium]
MTSFQIFRSAFALALFVALTAAKPIATPLPAFTHAQARYLSCQLPAPSWFDAERTGGGTTASLSWASVQGAESYSLKVYDLSTLALVSTSVVQGTSTSVTGLDVNKSYRCVLASMCSAGSVSEFVIVIDILI